MKAAVYHEYGDADVLHVEDVPPPDIADNEVLVEVLASSINRADWQYMHGLPYLMRSSYGLREPHVQGIGADFAGVVREVGSDVSRFEAGDEIFGQVNGETGGDKLLRLSACAELVAVDEGWIAHKPVTLSFVEAAAAPLAAITALQGLRDYGEVLVGDEVLINGSTGAVGTFEVQIAKARGAIVTAICGTKNVDFVKMLGADHVVDYKTQQLEDVGGPFDVIIDNVGNHSLRAFRRLLKSDGKYIASFGQPHHRWVGPLWKMASLGVYSKFVPQEFMFLHQHRRSEDIEELRVLLESGAVVPAIDRTYPLGNVPDAMDYIGKGHARAKVVITV